MIKSIVLDNEKELNDFIDENINREDIISIETVKLSKKMALPRFMNSGRPIYRDYDVIKLWYHEN